LLFGILFLSHFELDINGLKTRQDIELVSTSKNNNKPEQ